MTIFVFFLCTIGKCLFFALLTPLQLSSTEEFANSVTTILGTTSTTGVCAWARAATAINCKQESGLTRLTGVATYVTADNRIWNFVTILNWFFHQFLLHPVLISPKTLARHFLLSISVGDAKNLKLLFRKQSHKFPVIQSDDLFAVYKIIFGPNKYQREWAGDLE
uniref:Expressed protein n=1 Tax=Echinococcus granulosus TaxID=6210 RepID=A0A068WWD5_ECHGR|nr:expressed protein [Echinococcus granulosus]